MTVIRAREILGRYGNKLSDKEVEALIENFSVIINIGFEKLEPKITESGHSEVLQCQKI